MTCIGVKYGIGLLSLINIFWHKSAMLADGSTSSGQAQGWPWRGNITETMHVGSLRREDE